MAWVEARQRRILTAMGGAFAAAVGVGLAAGLGVQVGHGRVPDAVLVAGAAVLVAVALLACVPWWRRMDAMAREAHTSAWWWGGAWGMGVGMLALAITAGARSPQVSGGLVVILLEVAGYVGGWLLWWASKRAR